MRQDSPAEPSRSMIDGRLRTGVFRNAPPNGRLSDGSGMQLGTFCVLAWTDRLHGGTLPELQPHPGPGCMPRAGFGLLPVKPSRLPMAAYRWPPHDGEPAMLNVASEIANRFASETRFGTWLGS